MPHTDLWPQLREPLAHIAEQQARRHQVRQAALLTFQRAMPSLVVLLLIGLVIFSPGQSQPRYATPVSLHERVTVTEDSAPVLTEPMWQRRVELADARSEALDVRSGPSQSDRASSSPATSANARDTRDDMISMGMLDRRAFMTHKAAPPPPPDRGFRAVSLD